MILFYFFFFSFRPGTFASCVWTRLFTPGRPENKRMIFASGANTLSSTTCLSSTTSTSISTGRLIVRRRRTRPLSVSFPPTRTHIAFHIFHKKKNTFFLLTPFPFPPILGTVTIPVNTITSRFLIEKWYPVVAEKSSSKDPPSLRIKCKYQTVDILPLEVYEDFLEVICISLTLVLYTTAKGLYNHILNRSYSSFFIFL